MLIYYGTKILLIKIMNEIDLSGFILVIGGIILSLPTFVSRASTTSALWVRFSLFCYQIAYYAILIPITNISSICS